MPLDLEANRLDLPRTAKVFGGAIRDSLPASIARARLEGCGSNTVTLEPR